MTAPGGGRDGVLILLMLLALIGCTANLGNQYLWQDEAETAVLGRHTLQYGFPTASDGVNRIYEPRGYGPHDAWIYHPWLQFYVVAGSFHLFGESTYAARLPFAVCGLMAIVLTFRLAMRLFGSLSHARVATALLVLNVPFLLYLRQARYYALATCLALWMVLAYLNWRESRPGADIWLVASSALLFHANHGVFLPMCGALMVHAIRWRPPRFSWRRFGAVLVAVGMLTAPMFWFLKSWEHSGTLTWERLMDHAEYYVRVTNKYLFPLAFVGLVWVVSRMRRRPLVKRLTPQLRAGLRLCGVLLLVNMIFVLLPDQRHLRYVIPLMPLWALVGSVVFVDWWRRSRWIGGSVLALVLCTTILHSPHARMPLVEFAYELTHDYDGPLEGIVTHLNRHAKAGETVKIPYGDRPLMFYTALTIEDVSRFGEETYPDWIVVRRDWVPGGFFDTDYYARILATYEAVTLPVPDLPWENRPDPGYHKFRTVQEAPEVIIYRRRSTAA